MRRTLGTLPALVLPALVLAALALAVALLAGCGDDAVVSYPDEGSTEAATPRLSSTDGNTDDSTPGTDAPAADGEPDIVALPSASNVGGSVATTLTPIDSPAELDTFVSQFTSAEFAEDVRTAATTSSYDGELHAAVVAVGCDVPPGVLVQRSEGDYRVRAEKVADPLDTCLVPVTTVALVSIG